jgi:3-oxoacyl-[acyl-carrier-protein] synthase III
VPETLASLDQAVASSAEGPFPAGRPDTPVGARIGSVALAVPETVVTNAPIAERLGVEENWIVSRMGVRERRVIQPEERVSDLATRAARAALERAGLEPTDLDLILVGTISQDELTPGTAPLVAYELGAPQASALDVGAACTAFLGAVQVAAGQIEAGRSRNALVVGIDALHRWVDPEDKRTAGLFGDGAGAAVMTASQERGGIGPIAIHSDGSQAWTIYADREEGTLYMEGGDTYKQAVNRLSEVTLEALELAGLALEDIDLFVYHQANQRILKAVGERLGLPDERVVDVIETYGNTSAGSIPIALVEAEAAGQLHDGSKVLLGAIGSGLVWGAGVIEWGGVGGN